MTLEKIQLEHVPSNIHIYATLFRDVSNADFLHSQLLARNPDFEYAFVDASSVISRFHLLSAVYAAVNALVTGTLRTPNVHSEIVVSLNTNNNIADAYRRWGITPGKTKDLIVVKVVVAPEVSSTETTSSPTKDKPTTQEQQQQQQQPEDEQQSIWTHLTTHVKGTPSELSDANLAPLTDWPKVRKYYRLNAVPALAGCKDDEEKRRQEERLAVMGMALKGL
ncbi:hypothetical protein VTJ49DRAFT_3616 [Mycothermus thermophilus]|uniref:EKC/KEOPS complex subunit CGI121 n=1 Tax=Humicola insolens TaxID=85995 RepID=A0ABR3V741_HUMIN